jgi:hypothetical protein
MNVFSYSATFRKGPELCGEEEEDPNLQHYNLINVNLPYSATFWNGPECDAKKKRIQTITIL